MRLASIASLQPTHCPYVPFPRRINAPSIRLSCDVEYALELRERILQTYDRPMILVGYANHYLGYIVTPRAMQTGGYEAAVARVGPNAGRKMTETAMHLLSSWERRK